MGSTLVCRKPSKLVQLYLEIVITNKIIKKKVLVGKANLTMILTQINLMIAQGSVKRTTNQEVLKAIIKCQDNPSPNNKLAQVHRR